MILDLTRLTTVAAATTLLLASSAGAQQRAALEGRWVLVDSPEPSVASRGDGGFPRGDMGSGWGSPLMLTVEPSRLVVVFNPYSAYDLQPVVTLAYPLGSGEAENRVDVGFAVTVFRSRAAWEGTALTTTDYVPAPPEVAGAGVRAEVRRRLTVAADTLVIETTRVGVAGAPTVTSRTIYTRSR